MKRYLFLIFPIFALACASGVILTSSPSRAESNRLDGEKTAILLAGSKQGSNPSPTPAAICIVRTGIPGGYLNLRFGPGISYQVLDVLVEGKVLTIIQPSPGDWLQITTASGSTGWVYSKFCEAK